MKKKKILSLLIALIFTVAIFTGCTVNYNDVKISTDVSSVDITLNEQNDGLPLSSSIIYTTMKSSSSAELLFRLEDIDVAKIVSSETIKDENGEIQKKVVIQGLTPGSTSLVAFCPENANAIAKVKINVYQPIQSITFNDKDMFVAIGKTLNIVPDNDLTISPRNANKNDLRYSLDNNSLNVTIDNVTGFIDARNATAGSLTIKVYSKDDETIYSTHTLKVVKQISDDQVSMSIDGIIIKNIITLVKTREDYASSTALLNVDTTQDIQVDYTIKDNFIVDVTKQSNNEYYFQAKELGSTTVTFKVNILGANNQVEPATYVLTIKVIDVPTQINVNGANATSSTANLTVYNIYSNSSIYGTTLRFTLSPSSVDEENSKIRVYFNNASAKDDLIVSDGNGNTIDISKEFVITAGTNLYVKAKTGITSGEYKLTAVSMISEVYGPVINANVLITVKEGILTFRAKEPTIYSVVGQTTEIQLAVGPSTADTSRITFVNNNTDLIDIVKNSNTSYSITALKTGEATITFYSGNGMMVTQNIVVYSPVTYFRVNTDEMYENGAIGEKINDADGNVSSVCVAVNKGFYIKLITNDGATYFNTQYVSMNLTENSARIVNIDEESGFVSILGEGEAKITVSISSYSVDGDGSQSDFTQSFIVFGYIPISSISLNTLSANRKDYTSVGYYKIESLSQLKLSCSIFPTSATFGSKVNWSIDNFGGSLSSYTGKNVTFTAGPLGVVSSTSVVVTASVTEYNRTYSQSCTIVVNKATMVSSIYLNNVVNREIPFDSRYGLNTESNSFTVNSTVYPINAENINLRYLYVAKDTNEKDPVFKVDEFGKVIPLKAGNATLRICAEDSFSDIATPKLYVDVLVTVSDGKSKDTAYKISNVNDLIAIGSSESTMSLYYVLTDNIDVSSITSWTPIGSKNSLSFTGYLSGEYKTDYVDYKNSINGLNFINSTINKDGDTYLGLFYKIDALDSKNENYYMNVPKTGTIENLTINVSTVKISSSLDTLKTANVYFGVLSAVNNALIPYSVSSYLNNKNETEYKITYDYSYGLINDAVKIGSFNYTYGKENLYIGGLVGVNKGNICYNDESVIALSGNALNITPILDSTDGKTTTNKFRSDNIFVGGITAINDSTVITIDGNTNLNTVYKDDAVITGIYKDSLFDDSNSSISFGTLFDNQGVLVTSSINLSNTLSYGFEKQISDKGVDSYSLNLFNNGLTSEIYNAVGGIAGINNGEINGVATNGNVSNNCNVSYDTITFTIYDDFEGKDISTTFDFLPESNVGGVIGVNNSILSNSYSTSKVVGDINVGGLVGQSCGNSQISFSDYEVYSNVKNEYQNIVGFKNVGGIAGFSASTIYNNTFVKSFKPSSVQSIFSSDIKAEIVGKSKILAGKTYLAENIGDFIGQSNYDKIYNSYAIVDSYKNTSDSYYNYFIGNREVITGTVIENCYTKNSFGILGIKSTIYWPNYSVYSSYEMQTQMGSTSSIIRVFYSKRDLVYGGEETNYSDLINYAAYSVYGNDRFLKSSYTIIKNNVSYSTIPFTQEYMVNDTYFAMPGVDSIKLSGNSNVLIGTSVNNGLPILIYNNTKQVPIIKESPTKIDIVVKNTDSTHIKVNGDSTSSYGEGKRAVVFLYDVYGKPTASQTKIISSLNTLNVLDIISLNITPNAFAKTNLTLTSSDSNILKILENGKLQLLKEGNVSIKISSITDPNIYDVFQIYVTKKITNFNLYKFANSSGSSQEYDNNTTLQIRKSNNTDFYPSFSNIFNYENYVSTSNVGVSYFTNNEGIGKINNLSWESDSTFSNYSYSVDVLGTKTNFIAKSTSGKEQASILAVPFYIAYFTDSANGSLKQYKVYFNEENATSKNFNIVVYEGAQSIISSITSSVNQPYDTIKFVVSLTTDNDSDSLTYNYRDSSISDLDVVMNKTSTTQTTINGYSYFIMNYDVVVSMVDNISVRYISESITYNLSFYSLLLINNEVDTSISATIPITFESQKVKRIDLFHYTNGEVSLYSDSGDSSTYQYNPSESASTTLIPGISGLLKINLYPYYSNVKYIDVISSNVNNVAISLSQLVYNGFGYVAINPASALINGGLGLRLQKQSNISNNVYSFNGILYVKTLIPNNVEKDTEITITVKSYNLDENNNVVDLSSSSLVLYAKEIPGIYISVDNSYNSAYAVRGTNTNVDVKLTGDFSNSNYTVTMSTSSYLINSVLDLVTYNKGDTTTFNSKGEALTTDSLYVGIGVPKGTTILVTAVIETNYNGIIRKITSSLTLTVVDFLIKNIDSSDSSLKNDKFINNLTIQEYYKFGIQINFVSAPKFETAMALGYNINDSVKDDYNEEFAKIGEAETFVQDLLGNRLEMFKQKNGNDYVSLIVSEDAYTYYNIINKDGICYLVPKVTGTDISLSIYLNYGFSANGEFVVNIDNVYSTYKYNEKTEKYEEDKTLSSSSIVTQYTFVKDLRFNIVLGSTDNLPIAITNQSDLMGMVAGQNYILTQNLTLIDWTPISTAISSLDGNGYYITIKSFNIANSNGGDIELGLFSEIDSNTLLKNVYINVNSLLTIDLTSYQNITFGLLVANNNGGILTNCAIINYSANNSTSNSFTTFTKVEAGVTSYSYSNVSSSTVGNIRILTSNRIEQQLVSLVYGTLVGVNNGNITNSRVGEKSIFGKSLSGNDIVVYANGIVGGMVGKNYGYIVASYVDNISITNNLENALNSELGGFVAENAGTINGCFVRGSDSINSKSSGMEAFRTQYGFLYSTGSVGGFVYSNSGKIEESYSNISVSSVSSKTAGFVYSNLSSGNIKDVYSSSKITGTNSSLHNAFVGVDDESNTLNHGTISNAFFLKDNNYLADADNGGAISIPMLSFTKIISFNGFTFTVDNLNKPSSQGIWKMNSSQGPELVSCNIIAFSQRYLQNTKDSSNNIIVSYYYEDNHKLGDTEDNPVIIRNAEEFNNEFKNQTIIERQTNAKYINNRYIRLVNNIDFDDVGGQIYTKDCIIAGTIIDGNGFTINNIHINADNNAESDYIGLFKEIISSSEDDGGSSQGASKSLIKNLTLSLQEENALKVSSVGVLSGIIKDSNIFNINISCKDSETVIKGKNVVGGLAGIITGDCYIVNITSNVSVQSTYKNANSSAIPTYYDGDITNISKISQAGALAGVIDIKNDSTTIENVALYSRVNVKFINISGFVRVTGEFAGGVAGFIGQFTNVYDAKFEIQDNSTKDTQFISGSYASGGIVGINFGVLNSARICYSDKYQSTIDSQIASNYISNTISNGLEDLFTYSSKYMGGVAGINIGGTIKYSYSRIDVRDPSPNDSSVVDEQYVGGLVGFTRGGEFEQCYATGSVLSKKNDYSYSGGLIGYVSNYDTKYASVKNCLALNNYLAKDYTIVSRNDYQFAGLFVGFNDNGLEVSDYSSTASTINLFYVKYEKSGESSAKLIDFKKNDLKISFIAFDRDSSTSSISSYLNTNYSSTYSNKLDNFSILLDKSLSSYKTDLSNFYSNSLEESIWFIPEQDNEYYYPKLKLGVQDDYVYVNRVGSVTDTDYNKAVPINNVGACYSLIYALKQYYYKTIYLVPMSDGKFTDTLDLSGISFNNNVSSSIFSGKLKSYLAQGKMFDENNNELPISANNLKLIENETEDIIVQINIKNINITYRNDSTGKSFGFFPATKRATFSNINFTFTNLNDYGEINSNKTVNAGAISAIDESSVFDNINVEFKKTDTNNNIVTVDFVSFADNFGGIVGKSNGLTSFNDCSFSGNLQSKFYTYNDGDSYVGGLIGCASGTKLDSTVVKVNIEYVENKDIKNTIYIGGIYGKVQSTTAKNNTIISNISLTNNRVQEIGVKEINIGSFAGELDGGQIDNLSSIDTDKSIKILSILYNDNIVVDKLNIGGIIGKCYSTKIQNIITKIKIDQTASLNDAKITTANIGGLVGELSGGTIKDVTITSDNSTNDAEYIKFSSIYVSMLNVGGLVGVIQNNSSLTITNIALSNNIIVSSSLKESRICVGGFIGICYENDDGNSGKSTYSSTTITSSIAQGSINIKDKSSNNNKINNLYVGGIVGFANAGAGSSNKNCSISYCLSYEKIYANNNDASLSGTCFAGGICGQSNSEIKNSVSLSELHVNGYKNQNISGITNYTNAKLSYITDKYNDSVSLTRFTSRSLQSYDIVVNNEIDKTSLVKNIDGENGIMTLGQNLIDVILKDNTTLSSYYKGLINNSYVNVKDLKALDDAIAIGKNINLCANISVTSNFSDKNLNAIIFGNGYTILKSSNSALFSSIGVNGAVCNLGYYLSSTMSSNTTFCNTNYGILYNIAASINATFTFNGNNKFSSLVYDNYGKLVDCGVKASIVFPSSSSVDVTFGGLVYSNNANSMIYNCFITGNVYIGNYVGVSSIAYSATTSQIVNCYFALNYEGENNKESDIIYISDNKNNITGCSYDKYATRINVKSNATLTALITNDDNNTNNNFTRYSESNFVNCFSTYRESYYSNNISNINRYNYNYGYPVICDFEKFNSNNMFDTGNGTINKPYQIVNAGLLNRIESQNKNCSNLNYKLMNSIYLDNNDGGIDFVPNAISNWKPIEFVTTSSDDLTGVLPYDGNGKTITKYLAFNFNTTTKTLSFDGNDKGIYNLIIGNSDDATYTGLFTRIGNLSENELSSADKVYVHNLVLRNDSRSIIEDTSINNGVLAGSINNAIIKDIKIYSKEISKLNKGQTYFGSIVGYSKYSTIENCDNNQNITSSAKNVGGIVGQVDNSIISSCKDYYSVSGSSSDYVGGIIGKSSNSNINNSSTTSVANGTTIEISGGKYVGGIIGYATITNIDSGCSVKNSNIFGTVSGGIVAFIDSNQSLIYNVELTKVIVFAGDIGGGLVGYSKDSRINNCSFNGSVYLSNNLRDSSLSIDNYINLGIIYDQFYTNYGKVSMIGGLFGYLNNAKVYNDNLTGSYCRIDSSYSNNDSKVDCITGGFVGYAVNSNITKIELKSTTTRIYGNKVTGGVFGIIHNSTVNTFSSDYNASLIVYAGNIKDLSNSSVGGFAGIITGTAHLTDCPITATLNSFSTYTYNSGTTTGGGKYTIVEASAITSNKTYTTFAKSIAFGGGEIGGGTSTSVSYNSSSNPIYRSGAYAGFIQGSSDGSGVLIDNSLANSIIDYDSNKKKVDVTNNCNTSYEYNIGYFTPTLNYVYISGYCCAPSYTALVTKPGTRRIGVFAGSMDHSTICYSTISNFSIHAGDNYYNLTSTNLDYNNSDFAMFGGFSGYINSYYGSIYFTNDNIKNCSITASSGKSGSAGNNTSAGCAGGFAGVVKNNYKFSYIKTDTTVRIYGGNGGNGEYSYKNPCAGKSASIVSGIAAIIDGSASFYNCSVSGFIKGGYGGNGSYGSNDWGEYNPTEPANGGSGGYVGGIIGCSTSYCYIESPSISNLIIYSGKGGDGGYGYSVSYYYRTVAPIGSNGSGGISGGNGANGGDGGFVSYFNASYSYYFENYCPDSPIYIYAGGNGGNGGNGSDGQEGGKGGRQLFAWTLWTNVGIGGKGGNGGNGGRAGNDVVISFYNYHAGKNVNSASYSSSSHGGYGGRGGNGGKGGIYYVHAGIGATGSGGKGGKGGNSGYYGGTSSYNEGTEGVDGVGVSYDMFNDHEYAGGAGGQGGAPRTYP